ncbi:hypothetical protein J2T12_003956 [Paenibacillus anaericanus]|uniref:hypothetical protein n=1 Tax=Paenibacillus anaericanus TaxID=170367 RepID=UPI00278460A2|nr:hypothetical protein [Paenibacillus anaericanus]MDQ0090533.1 hypothetical protein [Paenibacillus anaericanus]
MRENINIKLYEQWLKRNYGQAIANAPVNSMTPLVGELPDSKQELIFVTKAESWLYEPLKGKGIDDTVLMDVKAYPEGDNLIWNFDIEPNISFESKITTNKIEEFLNIIIDQDYLTVVIVDQLTMNIVWMTNNYPLLQTLLMLRSMFKHFGVR